MALSHCCCNVIKISLYQLVHESANDGRADKARYIVRSHPGTTTGTERSSDIGGRREAKARSEHVVVERSMPVRQPLRMTDHRESSGWTSRADDSADRKC